MKRLAVRLAVLGGCVALAACAGSGPRPPRMDFPPPPMSAQAPPPPYRPATPPPVTSAGPLKSAMVGSYMDTQEQELRRQLRGSGVLVARQGDEIVLHLKSDDMFAGNTLNLSDQAKRVLAVVAPILRRYDHTAVFINAYTDTTGSEEKNLEISRKRAYTIGGQLVKYAVPLARLQAKGYGEAELKIATGDQVNEPRNRRIQIRIVPSPMEG